MSDSRVRHYHDLLGSIASDVGSIQRLLMVFFSFLHQRTDFYIVDPRPDKPMGFDPGVAEKMILAAFAAFSMMSPERSPLFTSTAATGGSSPAKPRGKEESMASNIKRSGACGDSGSPHVKKGNNASGLLDSGDGNASISSSSSSSSSSLSALTSSLSSASSSSSLTMSSSSRDGRSSAITVPNLQFISKVAQACRLISYVQTPAAPLVASTAEAAVAVAGEGSVRFTPPPTSSSALMATPADVDAPRGTLQIPYLNGGVGKRNRFWWTQTLHDVTINFTIPHALKGSQIRVEVTRPDASVTRLVSVRGTEGAIPSPHNQQQQQLLRIFVESSATAAAGGDGEAVHTPLFQGTLWEEVTVESMNMSSSSSPPLRASTSTTASSESSTSASSNTVVAVRSSSGTCLMWTLEEIVPSEAASLLAQERPLDLQEPPFASPAPASSSESEEITATPMASASSSSSSSSSAASSSSTTVSAALLIEQTLTALPSDERSLWLGPCKLLSVSLHKKAVGWWRGAITGDALIDATLVDSTQTVDSYDAETQTAIRKVIHEQSLKASAKA